MTTYQDIKAGRRLTWAGIFLGISIALGLAIANFTSEDGSLLMALAFLALMSIPAGLAFLALDRRPSLLTAASMAALIQSVILLTSGVGLLQLLPAVLWYLAGQKRPRPAVTPTWASWARPLLAAASVVPLLVTFIHLDPICTVTGADGTVISSEVDQGARSGWNFSPGSITSSSTDSDGVTRSCASDTVRPWESALSLVATSLILGIATRWPTADQLVAEPRLWASGRPA